MCYTKQTYIEFLWSDTLQGDQNTAANKTEQNP